MIESQVVAIVERALQSQQWFYINVHGSTFGISGMPDIVTLDDTGRFVAIECKAPGKSPAINQLRRAIEICKANGRYIIAYEDFALADILTSTLPTQTIGSEIGESEFEWKSEQSHQTFEIILK